VQERHRLLERIEQIDVVEDAVRDLYLHMKDRTSEAELTQEQLDSERELLKGQNILTVLGALHASLKSLWAFKVDAEAELRGRAASRAQADSDRNSMLQDQMRRLKLSAATAESEMREAKERLRAEQKARAESLAEWQGRASEMAEMQERLTQETRELAEENGRLRAAMDLAMDEGRKRDDLVLKNKELQSARHFDKIGSTNKLRQQWHEHLLIMREMENEVKKRELQLAEKQNVEEKLKRAQIVLDSQKMSLDMEHVKSLERKVRRLEGVLANRDKEIQQLKKQLALLRGSHALSTRKVSKSYGWGTGMSGHTFEDDSGDPNHPMQRDLVDVKSMHKKAVERMASLRSKLDKPPFLDQFEAEYEEKQKHSSNSRNLRFSAADHGAERVGKGRLTATFSSRKKNMRSKGSFSCRSGSRELQRESSVSSNSMIGLKEALLAGKPSTAGCIDPLSRRGSVETSQESK